MIRADAESGMTLTEVVVVFVLAGVVMSGIVGFYLNSQRVWADGSTQAISQREASLVLDAITARARLASGAIVSASPDSQHVQIALAMPGAAPDSSTYYYWFGADSLIHEGYSLSADRGPMLTSHVLCFAASSDSMLRIDSLRVRSGAGAIVTMSTMVAFQNR